jgi:hypothetical protein
MNELSELELRAKNLRERFTSLLNDLGLYAPSLHDLHADLAEIDEHLAVLAMPRQLAVSGRFTP